MTELRAQWTALATEPLNGLPCEALIASIRYLACQLLMRTGGQPDNEVLKGAVELGRVLHEMGQSASEAVEGVAATTNGRDLTPVWQDRVRWLREQLVEDERLATENFRHVVIDCAAKRELIDHALAGLDQGRGGGHVAALIHLLKGYANRSGYVPPAEIDRG